MRFTIFDRFVPDEHQRRNNEDLLTAVNEVGQLLYFGAGVPTFTPKDANGNTARALFIRTDGGTTTTLYVYTGAGWTAK